MFFLMILLISLNVFSISLNELRTEYIKGENNWNNFQELLLTAPVELINGFVLPKETNLLLEGETINLHFKGNELRIISFQIKNNTIINARERTNHEATMKIELTDLTVKKIMYSNNPVSKFLKAKNSREIKITPIGLIPSIKITVIEIISGIIGFFF